LRRRGVWGGEDPIDCERQGQENGCIPGKKSSDPNNNYNIRIGGTEIEISKNTSSDAFRLY